MKDYVINLNVSRIRTTSDNYLEIPKELFNKLRYDSDYLGIGYDSNNKPILTFINIYSKEYTRIDITYKTKTGERGTSTWSVQLVMLNKDTPVIDLRYSDDRIDWLERVNKIVFKDISMLDINEVLMV